MEMMIIMKSLLILGTSTVYLYYGRLYINTVLS